MKLTVIEQNVLMVALDHMSEHLSDIRDEVWVEDKILALSSLLTKIHINYESNK
jgi:hypothetical protein